MEKQTVPVSEGPTPLIYIGLYELSIYLRLSHFCRVFILPPSVPPFSLLSILSRFSIFFFLFPPSRHFKNSWEAVARR